MRKVKGNSVLNLFVLLFVLFLLGFPCLAYGQDVDYNKLNDIHMRRAASIDKIYKYENSRFNVNFSVYLQDNSYSYVDIFEKLDEGSRATFKYAKENDLPIRDCRVKNEVGLFIVNNKVLNDQTRFYEWKQLNSKSRNILALYDPVFGRDNFAAIVFSEQGTSQTSSTVTHEVAHYWYDRFCWERVWDGNTEQFAQIVEKYFLINR